MTKKYVVEERSHGMDTPRQAFPIQVTRARAGVATEPRYVQRTSIERMETNDSELSLKGSVRSGYDYLALLVGLVGGCACLYFLPSAFSFAIKASFFCAALFAGYMYVKSIKEDV